MPLKLYFNDRGIAKLLIGAGKGKKSFDKRETEKNRDWNREKSRIMKREGGTRAGLTRDRQRALGHSRLSRRRRPASA